MEIGLSTLLFPHGELKEIIEIAEKSNLDFVEIVHDLPHFPPDRKCENLKMVKELIESSDLGAEVHAPFWDLNPISPHENLRELSLQEAKKSIDFCEFLQGEVVTIHPGRCWLGGNERIFRICKKRFNRYLTNLCNYAGKRKVKIGVETGSNWADYPKKPDELLQTIRGESNAGITLDIGHLYLLAKNVGQNIEWICSTVEKISRQMVNVHIHDNDGESDKHLALTKGKIDLEQICKTISKKYNGPITIELWNPSEPKKAITNSIKFLRDWLR